ncbi:MAG: DUF6528 family protein [Pedobacter sp.]|nr:DUF6528 family protein [Pedobacter sp.]MDQ8051557.1 DUF6528 family protein [Pedobacter sp.]
MKYVFVLCMAMILISGCAKNEQILNKETGAAISAQSGQPQLLAAGDDWLWVANQTNNKIEIFAPDDNWSSTATGIVKFSWKPTTGSGGNGYSQYAVDRWVRPNDFKVRNVAAWGGNYLCAVGGGGLLTIAAYPSGTKKWAYFLPANAGEDLSNPHGCELLPNGNLAVAASEKDSVLLFASSTPGTGGLDNTYRVSKYLAGAHAVLWDPGYNRLWAIGNDWIFELEIGGTAASPTLTEKSRTQLLTIYGHDLSADLTNSNRLLCTTQTRTYYFNKNTKDFNATPAGIDKSFVKSLSNQTSGTFVLTRKDSVKPASSKPLGSAVLDWNTRYVDKHSTSGTWLAYNTRQVNNVYQEFYKAKVFRTPY